MKKQTWNKQDRQNYADRNILKAKTKPKKRKPPPTKEEWQQ